MTYSEWKAAGKNQLIYSAGLASTGGQSATLTAGWISELFIDNDYVTRSGDVLTILKAGKYKVCICGHTGLTNAGGYGSIYLNGTLVGATTNGGQLIVDLTLNVGDILKLSSFTSDGRYWSGTAVSVSRSN